MENGQFQIYDGNGKGCFTDKAPDEEDILAAKNSLKKALRLISSKEYDLFIMDEINICCALGLISEDDMLLLINAKPSTTELVFTGRGCPKKILEKADLITEMKEVRHYYTTKKLLAREGIER